MHNILDLGAHTGMSTLYMARAFPGAKVVAVEPQLQSFALLRLNSAQLKNVHLEYGAAWDKAATVKVRWSALVCVHLFKQCLPL